MRSRHSRAIAEKWIPLSKQIHQTRPILSLSQAVFTGIAKGCAELRQSRPSS